MFFSCNSQKSFKFSIMSLQHIEACDFFGEFFLVKNQEDFNGNVTLLSTCLFLFSATFLVKVTKTGKSLSGRLIQWHVPFLYIHIHTLCIFTPILNINIKTYEFIKIYKTYIFLIFINFLLITLIYAPQ